MCVCLIFFYGDFFFLETPAHTLNPTPPIQSLYTRSLKATEGRGSSNARVLNWFKKHDDGVSSMPCKVSALWQIVVFFCCLKQETWPHTSLTVHINQLAGRWLVNKNMAKPFQDHESALVVLWGWEFDMEEFVALCDIGHMLRMSTWFYVSHLH